MGKEGDGWVYLKGANSMAIAGLSVRNNFVALGGPLLSSYAQMAEKIVLSP